MPHKDPMQRKAYHKAYAKKWLKTPKGKRMVQRAEKYRKRWRETHKEQYETTKKRWRNKQRLDALVHYGGNPPKCACCRESIIAFLTIDHKNGGGAAHRRSLGKNKHLSSTSFYRWLKANDWPPEFQVLCFNCNLGKRDTGHCPHENIILCR